MDGTFAESNVAAFTRSRAAFDLKGVMSSLTVLRLRSRDLNLIERQLRAKVTQFPQFFQSAPIVLDVGELEGGVEGFPLAALVRALHVCRVVPVAVTNIDDAHRAVAAAAGLGVVTLSAARPAGDPEAAGAGAATTPPPAEPREAPREATRETASARRDTDRYEAVVAPPPPRTPTPAPRTPAPQAAAAPPAQASAPRPSPAPGGHRAPIVVRQPVRSGQLIYADGNDLIVLAPVNPGAQIVADGNIHVYAPMRGRAVAGAKGYADARIFCQRFEAELIAIAGAHLTFDDIPRDCRGKPAQVFLEKGACVIAPL